jgi:type II secretory pathway pseudopilin PulG
LKQSSASRHAGGKAAGFSLTELLISLPLMGLVLAGAIGVFASQNRTSTQQGLTVATEQNLRVGMDVVTEALRTGGYGVPTTNLPRWIPWVADFSNNPLISGTSPASISVAGCFQEVAKLSAGTAAGATTLSLTSRVVGSGIPELLSPSGLILIDGSENAQVTAVNGSSITIDTAPSTAGRQGLVRAYPQGAPICRVDVRTLSIYADAATGQPFLGVDIHRGSGPQRIAAGISNLAIATVESGKQRQYQITLTAQSAKIDPGSGAYLTRSLRSSVTFNN